jgi:hypothetical protein
VVEIPLLAFFGAVKNALHQIAEDGWMDGRMEAIAFLTLHRSTETMGQATEICVACPLATQQRRKRKLTSLQGKESGRDMSRFIICTLATRQNPLFFSPLSQLGQVAKASVFLLGTSGHSVVSTAYIR